MQRRTKICRTCIIKSVKTAKNYKFCKPTNFSLILSSLIWFCLLFSTDFQKVCLYISKRSKFVKIKLCNLNTHIQVLATNLWPMLFIEYFYWMLSLKGNTTFQTKLLKVYKKFCFVKSFEIFNISALSVLLYMVIVRLNIIWKIQPLMRFWISLTN